MELDFDQWLEYGVEHGFCSEQYCDTHDGPPMSDTEVLVWEDGQDPCLHVVRLGTPEDWEADAQGFREIGNDG